MGQAFWSGVRQVGRVAVAAGLCGLMVEQPLLAEAVAGPGGPAAKSTRAAAVEGQARVLHALNRLTFGPRPGDLAAVQAIGLDKWFEMQLNPAAIDDSALDARLAQYPAMDLTIGQLEAR